MGLLLLVAFVGCPSAVIDNTTVDVPIDQDTGLDTHEGVVVAFPDTLQDMGAGPPVFNIGVGAKTYFPGALVDELISIYNGGDTPITVAVTYRVPGHNLREGYTNAYMVAEPWVSFSESRITIQPKETITVQMMLLMPVSATAPAQHWEYWVSIVDITQTSFVRLELNLRCLVNMR